MRVHQKLACPLAGGSIVAPASAEPVAARCKIERTINLGDTVETEGEIKATPSQEGANTSSILSLRPDGRWAHQEGLIQTLGGKGDNTFGPPTDHQVALLTRNPDKDRDVLCAARLAVESEILHAQGQSQLVQSILVWAQSLLDSSNNRGYNRDARSAAIKAERASCAARDDAARAADFAVCEARIAELSQRRRRAREGRRQVEAVVSNYVRYVLALPRSPVEANLRWPPPQAPFAHDALCFDKRAACANRSLK